MDSSAPLHGRHKNELIEICLLNKGECSVVYFTVVKINRTIV